MNDLRTRAAPVTPDEMPALIARSRATIQTIVHCVIDAVAVEHLAPEAADVFRLTCSGSAR
jgi:hypothetical protein